MFKFRLTPRSIIKISEIYRNGRLYDIKYNVLWKACKISMKDHTALFTLNPFWIKKYVPDISTIRHEREHDQLRIEWKKHGKSCWVKLKFLKAFNKRSTIKYFENFTYDVSSITKEQFDAVKPTGDDD